MFTSSCTRKVPCLLWNGYINRYIYTLYIHIYIYLRAPLNTLQNQHKQHFLLEQIVLAIINQKSNKKSEITINITH